MNWKKFKILFLAGFIISAVAAVPFIGPLIGGVALFTASTALLTGILLAVSLSILSLGYKILRAVNNDLNNEALADRINELPLAREFKPLTQNETKAFAECIKSKSEAEQKSLQKTLQTYQDYMQDCCAISLEPLSDLKDPLTIERINPPIKIPACKTYSAKCIQQLIEVEGNKTKDPVMRCDLNDSNQVKIYKGVPNWIYDFVSLVRSIISPAAKHREVLLPKDARREFTRKKRESFYAQHSALFKKQDADLKLNHEIIPTLQPDTARPARK